MAFLGADTDELREVGQAFQEGKETTDTVITFLKALIAILKAASFFSGGASAAYAQYLETVVLPWLERISEALGLISQVLGSQAQAQDDASNGGTVDYGSLPQYQTPALPAPVTPYQGEPLGGAPTGAAPSVPTGGAAPTGAPTTTTGPTGSIPGVDTGTGTAPTGTTSPTTAPTGGIPGLSDEGPRLTIGENGHLMIDTGIDLDGEGSPLGTTTPVGGVTPPTTAPLSAGTMSSPTVGGPELRPADLGPAGAPAGGANGLGTGGGIGLPTGSAGGGGGGGDLGSGGSSGGSSGGGLSGTGGGPIGGTSGIGSDTIGGGNPGTSSGPVADGGMGGAAPGAESLGGSGSMPHATPTGGGESGGPSYGAAAGIAGGAAALGLGGAALASRAGGGSDAKIDQLSSTNGRGSRGEGVRELQERLTAAGYDTQGADGVWGQNTQAAYDAYRADHPLPVQSGQGYTSPTGYDYNQITGVRGNANVTPEFLRQVEAMSQRLGARPEHIMAAMSFETGGSFASDVRNPRSSATGLIQFMDSTARGLGTTTGELARMTPTEQLQYVERYFEPYRGRLNDLESVYTSILAGSPHSGEDALFSRGERAYGPNRELDADRNGVITAAEATAHVRARMGAGGN